MLGGHFPDIEKALMYINKKKTNQPKERPSENMSR